MTLNIMVVARWLVGTELRLPPNKQRRAGKRLRAQTSGHA
jgi:hypothetical protein